MKVTTSIVNDIRNFVFGLAGASVYGSCKRRKQKFVMSFTIADDTGDPYVFYIKEGRHTLRIEAVPGETEVEKAGIGQVQPLAIDWIRIVPAGNV